MQISHVIWPLACREYRKGRLCVLQQFNHSQCERPLSLEKSEEEARMSGKDRVNADDGELCIKGIKRV